MNTTNQEIKTSPRAPLTREKYEEVVRQTMIQPTQSFVDEVMDAHAAQLSEGLVMQVFAALKKRERKAAVAAAQKSSATKTA